jgi:hypothetical protein
MSNDNPSAAGKQEPFAWCSKLMLRRIREQIEEYSSALSVYVALCWVASDKERDEFVTTHGYLAQLSGCSEKTVRRRLADLTNAKVVHIETPAMKAPCTYRLLSFGHGYRTLGNGVRTFGHGDGVTVTDIRSYEVKKGEVGRSSTFGKLHTAERIALENRLKALQAKEKRLAGDLSDRVQKETRPDDVARLKRYREEISNLERELGYDID